MKHEFGKKAPLLRAALAIAALSVTLSIGGFIDYLATDYAGYGQQGLVLAAVRMR